MATKFTRRYLGFYCFKPLIGGFSSLYMFSRLVHAYRCLLQACWRVNLAASLFVIQYWYPSYIVLLGISWRASVLASLHQGEIGGNGRSRERQGNMDTRPWVHFSLGSITY
ncbi:hypothetical protein GQ43DRAFT_292007 [Delitschia confertaspora ATCC 74209]|uniref:Uncharacterized protein n=1 Tax=Delitschia confertaspora ATCC 74209 TaxID=1513339 RepID=A0A9P4MX89_9PLEO|nr:hypothetical protein GQ43DRAFT_292007 [Delitschia confertaspora ATCC 74209]